MTITAHADNAAYWKKLPERRKWVYATLAVLPLCAGIAALSYWQFLLTRHHFNAVGEPKDQVWVMALAGTAMIAAGMVVGCLLEYTPTPVRRNFGLMLLVTFLVLGGVLIGGIGLFAGILILLF